MKNVAIICEYNLFHKGHKYQIEQIRDNFNNCCVIALMSGNFVQRGDVAVLDKYVRAKTACENGVDIVFELPYPYSGGSAEYFARGAVTILNKLNNIDILCFGSESGDLDQLELMAERLSEFKNIKPYENISYIKQMQNLYEQTYNEPFVTKPNDILGVEYLKALKNSKIEPFVIKRLPNYSATITRKLFWEQPYGNPAKLNNVEKYILMYLRSIGATEGLEYLIKNSGNESVTLDELYKLCANKKYTNAKIRRTILNILLNTTEQMLKAEPTFVNLLAANDVGRKYLKNNFDIYIITKPAHYKNLTDTKQYEHSINADKFYTMAMANPQKADYFLKQKPFIKE
ncbi:MAG: nucleotidyltransferase family protein [Oscillospiraceae bacterium]|nr:nucleotidyltransferase family protein [Oscillospiraceae bacterium]